MPRRNRQVLLSMFMLVGALVGPAAPVAAQPPTTLDGERLVTADLDEVAGQQCLSIPAEGGGVETVCIPEAPTGQLDWDISACNDDGSGTVGLTLTGLAVGPYPGTYEEQLQVTFGELIMGNTVERRVLSFSAEFTIVSGSTVITGSKTGVGQQLSGEFYNGSCRYDAFFDSYSPIFMLGGFGAVEYEATIDTPDGSFHDEGTSRVRGIGGHATPDDHATNPDMNTGLFAEAFDSSLIAPTPSGPGAPATATLTPPDAVNTVGTQHTVTATVRDVAGQANPGVTVRFSTSGSSTASGSCTTDANGQCTFSYTGPQLPGADIITACADSNGNGVRDTGEPCNEATKAWMLPTSTAGQTTGGGQVFNAAGNDKIAFGYNAKSADNGLQGNCTVVDPSPTTNMKIKCLDVTSLVQSGTHATFFGNATVNGTPTTYRIDVDDLGEPGAGRDTFKIVTSSGYTAGGTITNGNIQVHN